MQARLSSNTSALMGLLLLLLVCSAVACLHLAVSVDAAAATATGTAPSVRLLFRGLPIRNALAPTLDGVFSAAGPCGGASPTFGLHGTTTLPSNTQVSLTVAFSGPTIPTDSAFHVAYYCAPDGVRITNFTDSLLATNVNPATTNVSNLLPLMDGRAIQVATTPDQANYTLAFHAPLNDGDNPLDCVIAVVDQNNNGGCVDVNLVPGGYAIFENGQSSILGEIQSPCEIYCLKMGLECVGPNAQYPTAQHLDCFTACANYTVTPVDLDSGNNIQCRMAHMEFAAAYDAPDPHCFHAGPNPTDGYCQESEVPNRLPSTCDQYCRAVFANCSSSNFYTDVNDCMSQCASFSITTLGSSYDPPVGNNSFCRLRAAQTPGACASAAPQATGLCAVTNPLRVEDSVSGVFTIESDWCSSSSSSSSSCCCVSGSFSLVHVAGSLLGVVSANVTVAGGAMCAQGAVNVSGQTFNFPSSVSSLLGSEATILGNIRQTANSSRSSMFGSLVLGGSSFEVHYIGSVAEEGPTTPVAHRLVLTNLAVPGVAPRICNVAATRTARINTAGMPIPPDPLDPTLIGASSSSTGPSHIGAATSTVATVGASVALLTLATACKALFSL